MEPFDSFDEFDTPKIKPMYKNEVKSVYKNEAFPEESVEDLKEKEITTEVVGIPEETKTSMPKSKKKKEEKE